MIFFRVLLTKGEIATLPDKAGDDYFSVIARSIISATKQSQNSDEAGDGVAVTRG
jgi:hypothetical protein